MRYSITGEYWITDTGEVIYCDGDVSSETPNHDAVVRLWLLQVLSALSVRVRHTRS